MRIGFASFDFSGYTDAHGRATPGGAGWYRMMLPQRELAKNGVDCVIGSDIFFVKETGEFVIRDLDGEFQAGLDVVVMQRWMHATAPDFIRAAQASGQVIINDVDDWYDGLSPANEAFKMSHPLVNPLMNRDHYRKILAASDGITVSTPFLADRMRRLNENVELVPNAIDLDRWPVRKVDGELVTVGWVGALPFRSRDLEQVQLGHWAQKNGAAFFHGGYAEGWPSAGEVLGVREADRRSMPMQGIENYPMFFRRFNVGIVPLSMMPFNFSKSAIKGLEYAASGIPFVASPTPAYEALERSGIGVTAQRQRDWERRLSELLDPEVRRDRGLAYRERVAVFDIKDRWVDWARAYERIAMPMRTLEPTGGRTK